MFCCPNETFFSSHLFFYFFIVFSVFYIWVPKTYPKYKKKHNMCFCNNWKLFESVARSKKGHHLSRSFFPNEYFRCCLLSFYFFSFNFFSSLFQFLFSHLIFLFSLNGLNLNRVPNRKGADHFMMWRVALYRKAVIPRIKEGNTFLLALLPISLNLHVSCRWHLLTYLRSQFTATNRLFPKVFPRIINNDMEYCFVLFIF